MLTLKLISEETERVIKGLEKKHFNNAKKTIETVLEYDKLRREYQQKLDNNKQQQNLLSKQIGGLMKEGKKDEANEIKNKVAELKTADKELQDNMEKAQADMTNLLLTIPNIPNEDVPEGKDANDNVVVKEGGEKPTFEGEALCHWDLCKMYNLVDFDLGVKITGAGFPIYIGKMARFQRALEAFFLDEARKSGYLEIQPPLVVNQASGLGTGQLPDKEGQMYHAEVDDLYLIPTAEVPVTNLVRDVIVDEADLPIKMTAHTPCFRSEAGSYGRDTRGLIRMHQFDKVEMVQIVDPDKSMEALEELTGHAEKVLQLLNLPYRKVLLCTGDMGFGSCKTYDLEVWVPAQNTYREISSCSNMWDFQARRMQARCKAKGDKKTRLVHTLNGSGLAVGRTLVAVLENYQNADGSITVPEVLRPYMGGLEVICQ